MVSNMRVAWAVADGAQQCFFWDREDEPDTDQNATAGGLTEWNVL